MCRVHQAFVGQSQQLVQRIEEHAAELRGGPTQSYAQIWTPNVPDKQSVTGKHAIRLYIASVEIVNDDGDRFRCVARRFQRFKADAPEFEEVAIVKRTERISGLSCCTQVDGRADAIAQF